MLLWTLRSCAVADLATTLNQLELDGWEIFQILPGATPVIVANRSAEREAVEAAAHSSAVTAAGAEAPADADPDVGAPGAEPWRTDVRSLLGIGQKIQAIKLVRSQTDLDLREAKVLVEEIQAEMQAEIRNMPDLSEAVRRMLRAGDRLGAIRYVRNESPRGLKEARAYVDSLA